MATTVIEQTRFNVYGPAQVGMRFGPYRVVAQLGAGGMAVVYSAVRESDRLTVALKVLPASWGTASELRPRLQRESEVLQRIQHPGVIRVLEVGQVDEQLGGGTYLAMEWLPDALDRVLRARFPRPLEPSSALRITKGVAQALASVHAAGLIHRDVKPSNILLRANGQPVLTDFGLVAALVDTMREQRLTPPDTLVGTADYLAPEVITGSATVDGRVDIYALGIVLYEMLTGYVPFADRDPFQTLQAHVNEPIPQLPASVPDGIGSIVRRALEKDPRNRFATAAEMVAAIETEGSVPDDPS